MTFDEFSDYLNIAQQVFELNRGGFEFIDGRMRLMPMGYHDRQQENEHEVKMDPNAKEYLPWCSRAGGGLSCKGQSCTDTMAYSSALT
jgi:hypothetical protein